MIRPVSHPATGIRFDLAAEQPASVIEFLADLRENLPSSEHGLYCESAGGGENERRVYVVRRPGGGYSVRHYPGSGHHADHHVIPESDEHKRGKDYASTELERFGLPAAQEVVTDNRAKLDVATLTAPRIMAVEFQAYNHLTDREYRSRTTRAMHAKAFTGQYAQTLPDGGVLPLWLHAFGMPGRWGYPVPSVAAQDTRWNTMPRPGSVTALGPRRIEAERCRVGSRWDTCPRTGRNWCGSTHPLATFRDGLKVGEVAAMTANKQLVPIRYFTGAVYLVSPEDAALYEELGGNGTFATGSAAGRASGRQLGPCRNTRHARNQPAQTWPERDNYYRDPAPVPVWAMPAPAPEPMPRLKPVCVRCGVRPAYGLCEGCKAEWSSIQIPPQDQLGSWAHCVHCRRRYRPAHPVGLCYDCQHNIPIRRKVT